MNEPDKRVPMVKAVTVRLTGTSVSATIPSAMADRLNIKQGDKLFAIETADGILFTPYDPTVAEAMEIYHEIAKEYRVALHALAQ
jgi:putative addiction module antidote